MATNLRNMGLRHALGISSDNEKVLAAYQKAYLEALDAERRALRKDNALKTRQYNQGKKGAVL